MAQGVTFMETIDHLGGFTSLFGAVLVLALAYIFLVSFALPRGRVAQAERVNRLRQKTNQAPKNKPRRYAD
ncbi:hypothetical protein THRCLA_22028 [Thraustotheca clavata]|uniref:Uncharacterized protein n=1 Tax=Thraustotheca clavata TaxID=74557 RepID=A0A1V9ZDH0_9STRA|nr:hypothetical protein THRCLA_22028 [Thraustotheca clavata]